MRRKMKLLRKILEHVEMSENEDAIPPPEFEDYTEGQVHYHIGLCEEAGYLVVYQPEVSTQKRRFPSIARMTWSGHEAVDKLRAGEKPS